MQEKRKALRPLQLAAKEENKVASFNMDRLFVEGKEVHLTATMSTSAPSPLNNDTVYDTIPLKTGSVVGRKNNKFQAVAAKVKSTEDTSIVLDQLIADQHFASAKHLVYAYCLPRSGSDQTLDYYYDDREHGMGRTLLQCLKKDGSAGDMLVCARWTNKDTDSRLGKDRFTAYLEAASKALAVLHSGT